jgi:hypothetical protein
VTGQWFSPVLWFPPPIKLTYNHGHDYLGSNVWWAQPFCWFYVLNNFNLSNCLDNVKEEEREYPIQWSLSSKLMNQIPKKKYSFHPSIKQLFSSWTTYAVSAYHNWCCEFESRSGRGAQHYVIKFVSDLRQIGGFLRFPPPIKLTATT